MIKGASDFTIESPRCVAFEGFSLHANTSIKAKHRDRLERLCRYIARPPIATERLQRNNNGTLTYFLIGKYKHGIVARRTKDDRYVIQKFTELKELKTQKKPLRSKGRLQPTKRGKKESRPE